MSLCCAGIWHHARHPHVSTTFRIKIKNQTIMVPFTIEDFDSAIEKIGEKLSKLAALGSDAVQLRSFSGRMAPFVFKTQLESCFLVKLKNAEVKLNFRFCYCRNSYLFL